MTNFLQVKRKLKKNNCRLVVNCLFQLYSLQCSLPEVRHQFCPSTELCPGLHPAQRPVDVWARTDIPSSSSLPHWKGKFSVTRGKRWHFGGFWQLKHCLRLEKNKFAILGPTILSPQPPIPHVAEWRLHNVTSVAAGKPTAWGDSRSTREGGAR